MRRLSKDQTAEEIIRYLQWKGFPYFFFNKAVYYPALGYRALVLALHGKISFLSFIRFCLPVYRGDIQAICQKIDEDMYQKMGDIRQVTSKLLPGIFLIPSEYSGSGWTALLAMFYEVTILDQYHANDYLNKESIVIDAGANIGIFSVLAGLTAKQVYAFEPSAEAGKVLRENIKNLPNVEAVSLGLGEKIATSTLMVNTQQLASSRLVDSEMDITDDFNPQTVQITTIDQFVKDRGLQKVDFIKMDTEGYEGKIIKGAKDTIERFHPVIICSAYHHKEDRMAIPALLPQYHYAASSRGEDDFIFT